MVYRLVFNWTLSINDTKQRGGGEGEVFCDSRITLGPYLRDVMYKWSLIESIPQIWTTLLLDVA